MGKWLSTLIAMFRVRIKIRFLENEWQFEGGNPMADNVIFQLAVTIPPKLLGVDFEIFV